MRVGVHAQDGHGSEGYAFDALLKSIHINSSLSVGSTLGAWILRRVTTNEGMIKEAIANSENLNPTLQGSRVVYGVFCKFD